MYTDSTWPISSRSASGTVTTPTTTFTVVADIDQQFPATAFAAAVYIGAGMILRWGDAFIDAWDAFLDIWDVSIDVWEVFLDTWFASPDIWVILLDIGFALLF